MPEVSPTPRVAVVLEQCWHRVPGGTAVSALRIAEAVEATGDVDQVGVAANHRHMPADPWVPTIPVRHLGIPRPLLYESWHRLRRPAVESATGSVDVIHATGMAVPPRSVPLLVTVNDLAWLHRPGQFTRRGVHFFRRSFELTRREADLVVCPSQATADDVAAAGLESDRIRVVPLGVTSTVTSADEVERVRRAWRLDRAYVLWVGTVEPRKNLPTLVQAFIRLGRPDLDLVLVGPEGWHDALPPIPEQQRSRVRVLGFVPEPDLAPLYAGAEVFCYPSLLEGFGLPVIEAMAQGTPVVTSVGTATEEVVGGGGVLVDPRQVDAVEGGLRDLLEDPIRRAECSRVARDVAGGFTWERTASELVALYKELGA